MKLEMYVLCSGSTARRGPGVFIRLQMSLSLIHCHIFSSYKEYFLMLSDLIRGFTKIAFFKEWKF